MHSSCIYSYSDGTFKFSLFDGWRDKSQESEKNKDYEY